MKLKFHAKSAFSGKSGTKIAQIQLKVHSLKVQTEVSECVIVDFQL